MEFFTTSFERPQVEGDTDLFGYSIPRAFKSVDRAVDESGADLQDAIVVVHAAADIGNGRPFLNARDAVHDAHTAHDLRHHQTAHLTIITGVNHHNHHNHN